MARKGKDTVIRQDHQYACRMNGYLTPPRTPRLDILCEDDDDDNDDDCFSSCRLDFNLHSSLGKIKSEDDLFFDFAEDFQDLRMPMLKGDCMWGTAALIRPIRGTADSSSDSRTKSASRSIVTTPLHLNFRSTSTTPVYFDDRTSSDLFTPISTSAVSSANVIGNELKDIDSSFKVSPTCFLSNSISLLSPNETESEEEIDVVGVTERPSCSTSPDSASDTKARENRQKELPCQVPNNSSSSSSDTDDSSSGRSGRNIATQGRVSHNDLERKRRDELKRKFDSLRSVVPDLETNERAPKVMILKKATSLVPRLHKEEESLVTEKENLKRMNDLLVQRLLLLAKPNLLS